MMRVDTNTKLAVGKSSRKTPTLDTDVGADQILTARLAELVLGWKLSAERFIMADRCWTPRWRFRPLVDLNDAFQLLDRAAAEFNLRRGRTGDFIAEVKIGSRRGDAMGDRKARVITLALARALGIEV